MSDPEAPELQPVADDGIGAVWVGMALWAIAGVILLVFGDALADRGAEWWLMVCGAGLIVGLVELGIFTARVAQEPPRDQDRDQAAVGVQSDDSAAAGRGPTRSVRTAGEHGAGSHDATDPTA